MKVGNTILVDITMTVVKVGNTMSVVVMMAQEFSTSAPCHDEQVMP